MAKIIDMERVRKALATLDTLAKDHPDRVDHQAPGWIEHLGDLNEAIRQQVSNDKRIKSNDKRATQQGI